MEHKTEKLPSCLTPGPWEPENGASGWRIVGGQKSDGSIVPIAALAQSSEADAALIAAAPKMLDLLVRWSRSGDASARDLQREARKLISELECAPSAWISARLFGYWSTRDPGDQPRRNGVAKRDCSNTPPSSMSKPARRGGCSASGPGLYRSCARS
jgi:hypothetical protein